MSEIIEIKLRFETQELYDIFMNEVIKPQLEEQNEENIMKLEYDFEQNIGIIKNN